jgi:uncharacterized protein YdhG (YjbR/CyaY superfamily)
MPKPKVLIRTVDEYIASQPEVTQAVLVRVRAALRAALPGAHESISYRIPTYKLDDRPVLYFAGWKQHYSLYPVTPHVVAALAEAGTRSPGSARPEGSEYTLQKGTIRFPLDRPVPQKLIARIAKLRAAEERTQRKSSASAPKSPTKRVTKPAKKTSKN